MNVEDRTDDVVRVLCGTGADAARGIGARARRFVLARPATQRVQPLQQRVADGQDRARTAHRFVPAQASP